MKVALYSRVSTDEQKKYGYSILAQKDELENYAKEHSYDFEHYCDEGYSGGTLKRPQLQRLLADVKQGKIKLILFVKLDRWFRSVPDYYKIQQVLEENKCEWLATQEDYETTTSSGRFKVNIMLSVNQQFKDATSERIKSVFSYKLKQGYTTNGSVPKGFGIMQEQGGKRIICTDEEMVKDLVLKTDEYCSLQRAKDYVNNKYGLELTYNQARKTIGSTLVYGVFHDVQIFKPIIDKETCERIINQMGRNNPSKTQKRTYIFKSLIRCPKCGTIMCGALDGHKYKGVSLGYSIYRCKKYNKKQCSHAKVIYESVLNRYIEQHLQEDATRYLLELENAPKEPKIDENKIRAKIKRLNDMYLEDKCTKEYFDQHFEELNNLLKQKPQPTKLKEVIEGNILELYKMMNNEEKNFFLRNIIDYIEVKSSKDFIIHWL